MFKLNKLYKHTEEALIHDVMHLILEKIRSSRDTHLFGWIVFGQKRFSENTLKRLH